MSQILEVSLTIECLIVSRDAAVEACFLIEVEGSDAVIHVRSKFLNGGIKSIFDQLGGLNRKNPIQKIKLQILLQKTDHMEFQNFEKYVFSSSMCTVHIANPGVLHEESFSKGFRKILNIIIELIHPDVKVLLSLLHDKILELANNRSYFHGLLYEYEVSKLLKVIK